MKVRIIVNLEIEGIHAWKGCEIQEVFYLKDCHRHIFHITCKKEVYDTDREIEIIKFKHKIKDYLQSKYESEVSNLCDFDEMSCEMIAEELVKTFELCYCSVLEDGENGAEIVND